MIKYNFEDINIGDEVYFDSSKLQNNHDLFWDVISKIKHNNHLIIKLDKMGYEDIRWSIHINEVKYHKPK